jgi:hypothetical protein
MPSQTIARTLIILQLAFLGANHASAYSVLTHEAVIDAIWETTYKPLILKRFPDATEAQLVDAHAYAYGGAIIQDMGYYPFGSKFFSDLVHYVRSGDFVINMLNEAQDLNEYAFALGAMAHYAADNIGHPEGVNPVEPLIYPKIRRKYGNVVTYEDNPSHHIKTEFSFDVLEVARGNYAPQSYHDFIGFKVSKPLLERAFQKTYSIAIGDIFKNLDLSLGTYRHTVSGLLPEMTKAAWVTKKKEIRQLRPTMTERQFRYNLSRASYEKEWDANYHKPGIGARILAFFLRIVPKIGPFSALAFKMPPPRGETMFMKSFDDTLSRLRFYGGEVRDRRLQLPDMNFDTGKPVRQGDYRMTDDTYCKLLTTLSDKKVAPSDELRANILAFFQDPMRITDPKALTELNVLKSLPGDATR